MNAQGYKATMSQLLSNQKHAWYERKLSHEERYILWHNKTYPNAKIEKK